MFYKTQDEYDNIVSSIASFEVSLAVRCVQLREQNDPSIFDKEEMLMMLQVCLKALKNYDITSEILTDDEIDYNFEIATTMVQNCTL